MIYFFGRSSDCWRNDVHCAVDSEGAAHCHDYVDVGIVVGIRSTFKVHVTLVPEKGNELRL